MGISHSLALGCEFDAQEELGVRPAALHRDSSSESLSVASSRPGGNFIFRIVRKPEACALPPLPACSRPRDTAKLWRWLPGP